MFTLSANAGWFEGDSYAHYFEAAKRGFKAIEELGWMHLDLDRARAAIDESGVAQSALLCRSRDPEKTALIENKHGIVWANAQDAFLSAVEETLEACLKMNVKNIVVTSGNERDDVSRYVQHTNMVTALRKAADIVAGSGVQIVLEPLNVLVNHKGYYLVTTAETADVICEVNSPDVKILYDVYHQQISEGNVIETIRNNIDLIGHIHVADVPGRQQPGTGELNYKNIFRAIDAAGYEGFVTFECGRTVDVDTVSKDMFALLEW